MNFRKSSKQPLDPPPHFQKIILQFVSEVHDRSIVYNGKNLQYNSVMNFGKKLQYDFPKIRGGGSKAVWNFPKNSSVLDVSGIPKRSSYNHQNHRIHQTHQIESSEFHQYGRHFIL